MTLSVFLDTMIEPTNIIFHSFMSLLIGTIHPYDYQAADNYEKFMNKAEMRERRRFSTHTCLFRTMKRTPLTTAFCARIQ